MQDVVGNRSKVGIASEEEEADSANVAGRKKKRKRESRVCLFVCKDVVLSTCPNKLIRLGVLVDYHYY